MRGRTSEGCLAQLPLALADQIVVIEGGKLVTSESMESLKRGKMSLVGRREHGHLIEAGKRPVVRTDRRVFLDVRDLYSGRFAAVGADVMTAYGCGTHAQPTRRQMSAPPAAESFPSGCNFSAGFLYGIVSAPRTRGPEPKEEFWCAAEIAGSR